MKTLETDVAIIGAGTAGMNAYRAVRSAGLQPLLIEGSHYGTMCARVGCMPSKLLIAAADAAHAARHTAPFGVTVSQVEVDGVSVMQRVKRERDRFVGFVLETIESMPAEDKLWGHARFLSDTLLQVDDHTQVKASRTVIATGSTPTIPELYQALGDRVVVNDDVFYWDDLPRRVLVVGTGVIGLELGQALSRLGVQVKVTGRSSKLGGITDPEVRESARKAFEADFPLLLNTPILQAERIGDEVEVQYATQGCEPVTERFDYVLLATGRGPQLSNLGLENTSAKLDEKGRPAHNRRTLQLDGAPIFIAGDVSGGIELLHEAADEGRIAGANAARYPNLSEPERRAPLAIAFTDPQIALIGTHFDELPPAAVVGEVDFSNQGRSRIMLKNYGKLRVYADRHGAFLGAEMAGPSAEHIGHLLAWAVQQGLTLDQMLAMPFYHPVIEEGLRTALRDARAQLEAR